MTVFHPPLGPELDAYLAALEERAGDLDPQLRLEFLTGIRERLHRAIQQLGHEPSPAQARQLLAELGPPELLVRRARDLDPRVQGGRLTATWVPPTVLGGQLLGMIGAAFFVPLIGTAAAIVVVAASSLWRWWEKVLSIVFGVAGAAGMAVVFEVALGGMDGGQFSTEQAVRTAIGIATLGISALGAIYLVVRAGRRALAVESARLWGTAAGGDSLSRTT